MTSLRATLNRAKRKRRALTFKQGRILAFVKRFIEKNGYPPSTPEISDHYRLSRNGVVQHLALIERKGYLKRIPNIARGLVVV